MAQFCYAYGPELYYGWNRTAARRFRTADGIVPWRLFWILHGDLAHLFAAEQLFVASGAGTAIGLSFEKDQHKARRTASDLLTSAFPNAG